MLFHTSSSFVLLTFFFQDLGVSKISVYPYLSQVSEQSISSILMYQKYRCIQDLGVMTDHIFNIILKY